MRAALVNPADIAGTHQRMVCVLGEMKELGERSLAEHEALGGVVAAAHVGLLISCGGLATNLAERAAEGGIPVIIAASAAEAATIAQREVRPSDVVLVKGSRSVGTEVVVNALLSSRGTKVAP